MARLAGAEGTGKSPLKRHLDAADDRILVGLVAGLGAAVVPDVIVVEDDPEALVEVPVEPAAGGPGLVRRARRVGEAERVDLGAGEPELADPRRDVERAPLVLDRIE